MDNQNLTHGMAACRPAPTSPATAAAQRRGPVAVEVYASRRARLRLLIDERAGGSQRAFAKALGYTRSNIFNFLSATYNHGRSIGERAARKLEHKAGLAYGWLDQAVVPATASTEADIDSVFAAGAGMTPTTDCPICGIPADVVRMPATAEEAIAFIGSHYNCRYDADKRENVRFDFSVHDLLSAFRWWFDTDLSEQAGHEAGGQKASKPAETRMDAVSEVVVEVGVNAPVRTPTQLPVVPAGIVHAITTYGDQRADDNPASAVTLGKIIADIRATLAAEQSS